MSAAGFGTPAALALFCAVLLSAPARLERDAGRQWPVIATPRLVVLLDNAIVDMVEIGTGRILAEVRIPLRVDEVAASIAPAGDSTEVFVSIVNRTKSYSRITAVDLSTARVREIVRINGGVFPYVARGPRSGVLYAIAEYGVVFARVDPATGALLDRIQIARPAGDWHVYDAQLSPDERRLFISFHGQQSGIDWIELGDSAHACLRSPSAPEWQRTCIAAHGGFAPFNGGVVVALGPGVSIVDSSGNRRESFELGLTPQNHFMEFALDSIRHVVYGIGSCMYAGGITETDLKAKPGTFTSVLGPSEPVCGGTIVLSPDRKFLAVAGDRQLHDRANGELTTIDVTKHAVTWRVRLSSDILKMVFLPSIK